MLLDVYGNTTFLKLWCRCQAFFYRRKQDVKKCNVNENCLCNWFPANGRKWTYDLHAFNRQCAFHTDVSEEPKKITFFNSFPDMLFSQEEPILGLFVLTWMHFSCWIQIFQEKFTYLDFFCKFDNKIGSLSARNPRGEGKEWREHAFSGKKLRINLS